MSSRSIGQAHLSPLKRALVRLEEMQIKLDALERLKRDPIAIIGIGCRFPGGAVNPPAFWQLLRDGVDAIIEIPQNRWDVDTYFDPHPGTPGKTLTRWGGFLDDIDKFDHELFGVAPREAVSMDPQQRLLLEVSWEALEDAGQAPDTLTHSSTGVFIGVAKNDYMLLQIKQNDPRVYDAYYASGSAHSIMSGRLSYVMGLQGPSITIDTACSSSLVAVHLACQSLRQGECDMALAGGVNVTLSPENTIALSMASMLSAAGRCKTFDASADGFVQGEGCGVIVLRRLSDAVVDGNRIIALICGTAVNQDGPSSGLTAPNGPSQVAVIRQALKNADLNPLQVGYVEAHGTATSLGDPIEVQALGEALCKGRGKDKRLIIGSVKTNVGHLEAAAGIAGLIKVVLALQHKEIPPHLHFTNPNPFVPWADLPIAVATKRLPWLPIEGSRIAGVSSFGFSGTNAHIVLQEAPERQTEPNTCERPLHLFALSAKCERALKTLCRRFYGHMMEYRQQSLPDVCFTANAGRAHFSHRLAAVVSSPSELHEKLRAFAEGQLATDVLYKKVPSGDQPRVAFLFTGQGSQYAGMGRRLFETQPFFRAVLEQCDQILSAHMDRSLLSLLYPEPESAWAAGSLLDQTVYAQPALFAIEYALAQLWRSWGIVPSAVMGHSLGEYVAACIAGAFTLEDGLKLIATRSRLMQALPPGGRMVAVFADERRVADAIGTRADEVSIAAVNGPENVVISGDGQATAAILEDLARLGIGFKPLNVSHAFHSKLMEPMLDEFERVAAGVRFSFPNIRLISNVSGNPATDHDIANAGYWCGHIRQPVRFHASMQSLYSQGFRVFVEIGPHPVLIGMGAACPGNGEEIWMASLRRGRDDWHQMLTSLGDLYAQGVEVNWLGFDKGYRRQRLALPTYPFQRERCWIETPERAASTDDSELLPAQTLPHPLLGHRLSTPLAETVFATRLSTEALPFLADHVVHGLVVFPATAFLEMATAAGNEVFGSPDVMIEDLTIKEALLLPSEENQLVELVLTPDHDGSASFHLFSLVKGTGASQWKMHASGRVLCDAGEQKETQNPEEFFETIRTRCTQRIEVDDFYRGLKARGLDFGRSFRGIEALWRCDGEAFAQVRLPHAALGHTEPYRVHPALLDACIQAVAAAVPAFDPSDNSSDLFMPMGLDRFRYEGPATDQLFSHVLIEESESLHRETMKVHVRIFDRSGNAVAQLAGLHLKRVDPQVLMRIAGGESDEWLYEVAWRPRELGLPENPTCSYFPEPARIAEATASLLPDLGARLGVGIYNRLNRDLDALCTAYIVSGLGQLGFDFSHSRPMSLDIVAQQLKIDDRYHRLLGRFLRILVEEGLLVESGDGWQVRNKPRQIDPDLFCAELLEKYRTQDVELQLLSRCGGKLAALLRAEADPLQLLFPGGNLELASRLYGTTPLAVTMNTLVKEAVQSAVSQVPEPVGIRILEIGAGTGGTTAHVLPALPPERTNYVFTDIGQTFLTQAAVAFSKYHFLDYKVLDIEKDPWQQGFAPNQFDLVIAANVLHATEDLSKTLAHVKRLLAPQGILILVEATRQRPWYDLTFGFTDGWWKFTDLERRSTSPLLDHDQWRNLLMQEGFDRIAAIPKAECTGPVADNAVILARSPRMERRKMVSAGLEASSDRKSAGDWIIFADRGGIGVRLAEMLEKTDQRCHLVVPGAAYGADGLGHWTVDPANPEDFRRLWRESVGATGSACRGAVHLWALDEALEADASVDQLMESQNRGCRSILHALQAMVSTCAVREQGFWMATRGVHPVNDGKVTPVPAHAPVWGLAKVIALEHPELRCVSVDLDPSGDTTATFGAELMFAEITSGDGEDQVAYRQGRRYVARLEPSRECNWKSERPRDAAIRPRRWELTTAGTLDGLELKPILRKAPGPGEVEIRVRATSLNFRDVMNVLGMRQDSELLGGECAGTIAAVGPGADGFAVGDEVVAVTQGAFSNFATAAVDLVVHKPKRMSFEQAAALPLAYLTAFYALHEVGNLQPGERILIHAAAGGVGMAATNLAISAGAEIFATAGSPQKRAFLRSLGVRAALNSRTLEFADQVTALTEGRGVDIVLNSLTDEFIPKSLSLLRAGGRFLEIGKSQIWTAEQAAKVNPNAAYIPIDLAEKLLDEPQTLRPMFLSLMRQLEQGALEPLPIKVFSFGQAPAAFRHMALAKHIGKIVVSQPYNIEPGTAPTGAGNEAALPLRSDGTYLITGGLAGLGLLVAQWMVENGARNLMLMARSEPGKDAVEAIAKMKEAAATISVMRGDVSLEGDLSEAMARISALGLPLRGVVHCAGVLDDGVLEQQQWARFQTVMAPKVLGAWLLHRVTLDSPLDFFVLFSSLSSIFGSAGQANHAAANAFLDALAHYRRALGLRALSLNWGAWSEIGAAVKHDVGKRIRGRGIGTIAPDKGLRALADALQSGAVHLVVSPMDWPIFLNQFSPGTLPPFYRTMMLQARQGLKTERVQSPKVAERKAEQRGLMERLTASPPNKRRSVLLAEVRSLASRALGLGPSIEVDHRQPLGEMGLDSLMAVELRNALATALGRSLPATLLFDYPSIEKVTDYLAGLVFGTQKLDQASSATRMTEYVLHSDALDAIENLSDEEIDRIFGERVEK
jgi:acyl transferase domain-containing protein/NADPH:quinone reductase-like Zn-dependent oxidoreductase/NAD(P)-dependent dehydrogenase (short-subunit alcohol dehydrogenase family)/acyl carrier protein